MSEKIVCADKPSETPMRSLNKCDEKLSSFRVQTDSDIENIEKELEAKDKELNVAQAKVANAYAQVADANAKAAKAYQCKSSLRKTKRLLKNE